jgi:hypothetical protein
MAQRVRIELTDDLDGTPADETLTFAIDGVTYDVDLTSDNAEKLRESLAPYIAAGRRVAGRQSTRKAKGPTASGPRRTRSASGRASGAWRCPTGAASAIEVKAAYEAAH